MSRVSGKPYFVYILWSPSACCFYIGISEDAAHRLEQHNSGTLKGWTARHRPWQLVYSERHPNYATAKKREDLLKAQKGGVGFFKLTGLAAWQFARLRIIPQWRDRWFKSIPRNHSVKAALSAAFLL